jgi:hypothetical protein
VATQSLSFFVLTFNFLRSLQWLRGPNKNVEAELETIRSNIRTARAMSAHTSDTATKVPVKVNHARHFSFNAIYSNIKSVLRNMRLIKPILITCGLMVFQRFTGNISANNLHDYLHITYGMDQKMGEVESKKNILLRDF